MNISFVEVCSGFVSCMVSDSQGEMKPDVKALEVRSQSDCFKVEINEADT